MKILIVLAHPETKSFNAAFYQTAINALQEQGHEIRTSDLYKMNFNPVSDRNNFTSTNDSTYLKLQMEENYASQTNGFIQFLKEEQEKVAWCDLMIWQFPLWWFSVPAILKGWIDRVFAMGVFYNNGRIYENGMLKGKKALLSLTTGGPLKNYSKEMYGEIDSILQPIHRGILEFLGFQVLHPNVHYSVERLNNDERKEILKNWHNRLMHIFKE